MTPQDAAERVRKQSKQPRKARRRCPTEAVLIWRVDAARKNDAGLRLSGPGLSGPGPSTAPSPLCLLCCHTWKGGAGQGAASGALQLPHPTPVRGVGVRRGTETPEKRGAANLVIGAHADFDELDVSLRFASTPSTTTNMPFSIHVFSKLAILARCALFVGSRFKTRATAIPAQSFACALSRQRPASIAACTFRRSVTATPSKASGHFQGVATPTIVLIVDMSAAAIAKPLGGEV